MCMQENTAKFKGKHMPFLHLYKLPFPSVSQSVRPLVPQFVRLSIPLSQIRIIQALLLRKQILQQVLKSSC